MVARIMGVGLGRAALAALASTGARLVGPGEQADAIIGSEEDVLQYAEKQKPDRVAELPRRAPRLLYRLPKFSGSIAECNRWTGQPHLHSREAARRIHQERRDRYNQAVRMPWGVNEGLSRRNKRVPH
jgi:hypothetical protein